MIIAARTYTRRAPQPRAQQLRDLVAAAQVLGVLRAEPAEVDHALDAGARRGLGEVDGGLAVLGGEVAAAAHRVDEVVGGLGALERLGQARARQHVALARVALARAAAAEGADVMTAREQLVDELEPT